MPLFVLFGLMQTCSAVINLAITARNGRSQSVASGDDSTLIDDDDARLLGTQPMDHIVQCGPMAEPQVQPIRLPPRTAEGVIFVVPVPLREHDDLDAPDTDISTLDSIFDRAPLRGGAHAPSDADMGMCNKCWRVKKNQGGSPHFDIMDSSMCRTCKQAKRVLKREHKNWEEQLRIVHCAEKAQSIAEEIQRLEASHPKWPNWYRKMVAKRTVRKEIERRITQDMRNPPTYDTVSKPDPSLD